MNLLLFLATLALSSASSAPDSPHAQVELASEVESFNVKTPFYLGVYFKLEEGWHTYWNNPGDSGLPVQLEWKLPEGLTAGPISWPVPERIVTDNVVNFGYEKEVLFPVLFTPEPSRLKPDGAQHIQVLVKWLECKDVCIPRRKNLELDLRSTSGPATPNREWKQFIDETLQNLPKKDPRWKITARESSSRDSYILDIHPGEVVDASQIEFFPDSDTPVSLENPSPATLNGRDLRLELKKTETKEVAAPIHGVLKFGEKRAILVEVTAAPYTPFFLMLLLAWLGGLILNLMPCVFPVISIKILAFVQKSGQSPGQIRKHGILFSLGVLFSFLGIAGLLILLRMSGQALGWGFQLQNPYFVTALGFLFFAMGLSLLGAFEMGQALMRWFGDIGGSATGSLQSFLSGCLAVVVASPCTGPFMASAIGFALGQPEILSLLIFGALAIGMASPYLILSFFPRALHLLPRPGMWMETFKQWMAFPMFLTVCWLGWVLGLQRGVDALGAFLVGISAVGFALWIPKKSWKSRTAALAALVLGIGFTLSKISESASPTETASESGIVRYSPQALNLAKQNGKKIFLYFTAAWCVTCKVNERVIFSSDVQSIFQQDQWILMRGDWTNQDPVITETLSQFGRSGVPLYLLYKQGADSPPVVLPEILTPQILKNALTQP